MLTSQMGVLAPNGGVHMTTALLKPRITVVATEGTRLKAWSHCDSNDNFLCFPLSSQYGHYHQFHDTHFFCCHCHHNWVLNPFHNEIKTRMHSSRMRPVHCSGGGWGGGGCIPGCTGWGVCIRACTGQVGCVSQHVLSRQCMSGQGSVCLGSVCQGGVSAWGCLSHTPCEQNHRCLWKHDLAATMLQKVIMKIMPLPWQCEWPLNP